jgi:hypothetical protein
MEGDEHEGDKQMYMEGNEHMDMDDDDDCETDG